MMPRKGYAGAARECGWLRSALEPISMRDLWMYKYGVTLMYDITFVVILTWHDLT